MIDKKILIITNCNEHNPIIIVTCVRCRAREKLCACICHNRALHHGSLRVMLVIYAGPVYGKNTNYNTYNFLKKERWCVTALKLVSRRPTSYVINITRQIPNTRQNDRTVEYILHNYTSW